MNTKREVIISLLIGSGIIASPLAAQANDSSELEELRALVQELDQKVRVLDRKTELAEEATEARNKVTPIVTAGDKGFGIKSADGKFEYKLRGLIQVDYRNYHDASGDAKNIDGFDFRRIRPTFEGTAFGKYDFRFTPEFGEAKTANASSTSGIVDAYIDARFKPWFKVRAGKFKPFVGLERLQSGSDIKFIERSYVSNNILPNRDLGVSVHGDLFEGKLNYAAGVFNGVVDGGDSPTTQDTNGDKDYAIRLFATPFKDSDSPLAGLGFGIAATHGNFRGTASNQGLPGYKTAGQQTSFFAYNNVTTGSTSIVVGDGDRTRWSPQAYYYFGPFGAITEYARVEQEVRNIGALASVKNKTANLKNDAWQVAASWLLTGEDASFKGVKPKKAFDSDGEGWGAFELVARYQENNIDEAAFTNSTFADLSKSAKSAQSWAAAVNWYLNQDVRLELDYEHTKFDGGAGTVASPLDRPDEKTLFTRLQYTF